jgi:hypothetical protein
VLANVLEETIINLFSGCHLPITFARKDIYNKNVLAKLRATQVEMFTARSCIVSISLIPTNKHGCKGSTSLPVLESHFHTVHMVL